MTLDRFFWWMARLAHHAQGKGNAYIPLEKEVKHVASLLPKAPLIIDGGANEGVYGAAMKTARPPSRIIAIEPQVELRPVLEQSGVYERVISRALADKESTATLYGTPGNSVLASLQCRNLDHFGMTHVPVAEIETVRFEDIWKNELDSEPIGLCKLDLEGNELKAFEGFGEAWEAISALQFEFGSANLDTRTFFRDYYELLTERGFKLLRITPFGLTPVDRYRSTDECFLTTNYLALREQERSPNFK